MSACFVDLEERADLHEVGPQLGEGSGSEDRDRLQRVQGGDGPFEQLALAGVASSVDVVVAVRARRQVGEAATQVFARVAQRDDPGGVDRTVALRATSIMSVRRASASLASSTPAPKTPIASRRYSAAPDELLARREDVFDRWRAPSLPSLSLRDGGVIEVEAVELACGVPNLEVTEEALEAFEAPATLVGEVEEGFAPEFGAIDDGAERRRRCVEAESLVFVTTSIASFSSAPVSFTAPAAMSRMATTARSWVTGSAFGGARWSKAASWSSP